MFSKGLLPGWRPLFEEEKKKPYFQKLCQFLDTEYKEKTIFPKQENIFRVLQETDVDAVKIVILGQDPYHGPNQALGRSFAVPENLTPKPPSLKNIFKEIESDIGAFPSTPNSELNEWAKQGVFMLNSVLTVQAQTANSHRKKGWEQFTDRIIHRLNERERGIVFLLWGASAKSKSLLISNPQHHILTAPHPSPLSAHRGFFGCRHFSKANAILQEKCKLSPIEWQRT